MPTTPSFGSMFWIRYSLRRCASNTHQSLRPSLLLLCRHPGLAFRLRFHLSLGCGSFLHFECCARPCESRARAIYGRFSGASGFPWLASLQVVPVLAMGASVGGHGHFQHADSHPHLGYGDWRHGGFAFSAISVHRLGWLVMIELKCDRQTLRPPSRGCSTQRLHWYRAGGNCCRRAPIAPRLPRYVLGRNECGSRKVARR